MLPRRLIPLLLCRADNWRLGCRRSCEGKFDYFCRTGVLTDILWCCITHQDLVKTAFDNGINMIDTAETYSNGQSEKEMYGLILSATMHWCILTNTQRTRHQGLGVAKE